jgi:hypothetical protein
MMTSVISQEEFFTQGKNPQLQNMGCALETRWHWPSKKKMALGHQF